MVEGRIGPSELVSRKAAEIGDAASDFFCLPVPFEGDPGDGLDSIEVKEFVAKMDALADAIGLGPAFFVSAPEGDDPHERRLAYRLGSDRAVVIPPDALDPVDPYAEAIGQEHEANLVLVRDQNELLLAHLICGLRDGDVDGNEFLMPDGRRLPVRERLRIWQPRVAGHHRSTS